MAVQVTSSVFHGLTVCATLVPDKQRRNARLLVTQGGGKFSNAFDRSVTHLLVGSVGSEKHTWARRWGTCEVTVEWVEQCIAQKKLLDAELFSVPPFLGLKISVTGLRQNGDRERVRRLVNSNGGSFSASLDLQTATHLVAQEAFGTKYEAAHEQRNIKIVTPEWVYHCVSKNRWEPESGFMLEAPMEEPIKMKQAVGEKARLVTKPVVSVHDKLEAKRRKRQMDENDRLEQECISIRERESLLHSREMLQSYSTTLFSHLTVFMCGMLDQQSWENAAELLGATGATLFWEWNPVVTHVIVGPAVTNHDIAYLKHIRSQNPSMMFLTYTYILDCIEEGNLVQVNPMVHVWPSPSAKVVSADLPITEAAQSSKSILRRRLSSKVASAPTTGTQSGVQEASMSDFSAQEADSPYTTAMNGLPLQGLRICISQFAQAERPAIVKQIQRCGGTYCPTLERGKTDHLVIKVKEGTKYVKALEWNIPIHSQEWLLEMASKIR